MRFRPSTIGFISALLIGLASLCGLVSDGDAAFTATRRALFKGANGAGGGCAGLANLSTGCVQPMLGGL